MKKYLLLFIVVLASSCGSKKSESPVVQPYELKVTKDVPSFDSLNVYKFVEEQLAFGSRNPNSTGHKEAVQYFKDYFSKYSDKLDLQEFTYAGYDNQQLNLTNIIARFNPSNKKRIFLCAHWDSRPWADKDKLEANKKNPIPGANDGASGVAVLMELARLLKEKPVDYGIDLILFDGEDYGKDDDLSNFCIGSKYFASTKPEDYQPVFGILLDLVGDRKAEFKKEGISMQYAEDIVELVWTVANSVKADAFKNVPTPAIYDDHLPLNQAGIKTIDIIDAGLVGGSSEPERNYWHTMNDDIKNISKRTLWQVGTVLTNLIYSLKLN